MRGNLCDATELKEIKPVEFERLVESSIGLPGVHKSAGGAVLSVKLVLCILNLVCACYRFSDGAWHTKCTLLAHTFLPPYV